LHGKRAFIRSVLLEELTSRMGHALDLGHAVFKTGLVANNAITYQFVRSNLKEVASTLSGAAGAQAIEHRNQPRTGC
jgi:hypothetical protein